MKENGKEKKMERQEVINQHQEPNITKICAGKGAASFPPSFLFPLFCACLHL